MATYAIVNLDGKVINITEWDGISPWEPPADTIARVATAADIAQWSPVLTDDDLVLAMPRRQRLAPTVAVGKAALKDLLDEQIAQAQAWDWFSTRVAAGTRPQAVKDAVAALALAEFGEAERLAVAHRQAT